MVKFISGVSEVDVDEENEAAFEAAGWSRVDEKPAKAEKAPK